MSSVDEIRAAFTVVTPLDTLPLGTSSPLRNSVPPLTVDPMLVSSDVIGDQLRDSIALSTKGNEVYNV
jgi:hypothetical protein